MEQAHKWTISKLRYAYEYLIFDSLRHRVEVSLQAQSPEDVRFSWQKMSKNVRIQKKQAQVSSVILPPIAHRNWETWD